jgi:CHAT domain-containing protein
MQNFCRETGKTPIFNSGTQSCVLQQLPDLEWNNPPVELLVLSACRTAVGDDRAELGFAGLAVYSGVKSALASIWYISDEGTLGLMQEFYQRLGQSSGKSGSPASSTVGHAAR